MIITPKQIDKLKNISDPELQKQFLFLYNYPDLRDALGAPLTNSISEQIGQEFSMDEAQQNTIAKTIFLLLTGGLPPQNLKNSIESKLNIPTDIKQKIFDQIQQKIVDPINSELIKAYQEFPQIQKEFMESQQPPTPPSPQPIAPAPENLPTDQISAVSHQISETERPPSEIGHPASDRPTSDIRHLTSDNQDIRFLAKKNPAILEQKITANYLIESGTGQSIPPTVKNWLLDYVRIAGSGSHSNLDRGRYLIKSPNAKNLTEDERNLVNKIIESYDSGSPLTVDINTGLLLLPNKRNLNFPGQGPNDVRAFQIMPVSFGNIVDLQDY